MLDSPIFVVLVVVAVVAIGAGVLLMRRAKGKKFEAFAAERGWRYEPRDREQLVFQYPEVYPFGVGQAQEGKGRVCSNILHLTDGDIAGQSFDYSYTGLKGSAAFGLSDDELERALRKAEDSELEKKHFHVVGIRLPQPLPQLTVRPKVSINAMPGGAGQRVQFESSQFNGAWIVNSEYPRAAHDVMHPRMMEWMLAQDPKVNLSIEDSVLFAVREGTQKLENIDQMLALLTQFVDQVPEHVWQKAQGEYPRPQRQRTTSTGMGSLLRAAKGAVQQKGQ